MKMGLYKRPFEVPPTAKQAFRTYIRTMVAHPRVGRGGRPHAAGPRSVPAPLPAGGSSMGKRREGRGRRRPAQCIDDCTAGHDLPQPSLPLQRIIDAKQGCGNLYFTHKVGVTSRRIGLIPQGSGARKADGELVSTACLRMGWRPGPCSLALAWMQGMLQLNTGKPHGERCGAVPPELVSAGSQSAPGVEGQTHHAAGLLPMGSTDHSSSASIAGASQRGLTPTAPCPPACSPLLRRSTSTLCLARATT